MENSIYIALSRQMALRNTMENTANNIANVNTSGFRAQNMLFNEFIEDPRGADDELSFVIDKGQFQTTKPGSIKETGNPLDMAVNGPGFFGVNGPGGQQMFSRAGQMQIDGLGTLSNADGRPISAIGGGQITIPEGSTEVNIDNNGVVSNQDGQLGQIMLHEFNNLQALEPVGNNLYRTDQAPQPPTETTVRQGYLEGSNVNAVQEMTRMIETLRDYQSMQNALKTENDRLRGAIQRLTQQ